MAVVVAQPQPGDYSDFSTETDFAKFKLIVEDMTLFVNPSAQAERSPVFAQMFYSDGFKEKLEQTVRFEEETHQEMLNFLQCLLPCSTSGIKTKPISAEMFPSLVRLADKYLVAGLTAECQSFILNKNSRSSVAYADASDWTLVCMLQAALKYHLSKDALAVIMGRAALMKNMSLLVTLAPIWNRHCPTWHRAIAVLMKAFRDHHDRLMNNDNARTRWLQGQRMQELGVGQRLSLTIDVASLQQL